MAYRDATLGYRTGLCQTGMHDRCSIVAVNGVRAAQRYVLCQCRCHDHDTRSHAAVAAVAEQWQTPAPADFSLDSLNDCLDVVNAKARPASAGDPPA